MIKLIHITNNSMTLNCVTAPTFLLRYCCSACYYRQYNDLFWVSYKHTSQHVLLHNKDDCCSQRTMVKGTDEDWRMQKMEISRMT
jgi:hypothetical protein